MRHPRSINSYISPVPSIFPRPMATGMMTIISPSPNTDNVGRQYFPRCYWWQRCSISPTWCCLYPCLSQVQDSSILIIVTLEPVCRKIAVTQQLFCCPLKVLNCTKLVLDDLGNNSFNISLESFRSFRGPLLHKPVTGQELFFDVSYSKPALTKPFKKNIKQLEEL